ncbi:glycoside hydrolase [Lophium mytilinum]|uniref:Glycoside hydrolase n=1 Tax=Lophium mytilinum TaxID=390894 RepID=A0A6A6RAT5_9PEZI|nr:glycoside hydrolase [Lophium mytilinum]
MAQRLYCLVLLLITLTPLAHSHGRITFITAENVTYTGWDPALALLNTTLPKIPAWSASNLGNIYLPPSAFNTTNITCHYNAHPGQAHVRVTAGHTVSLQWNEWPTSHKGPVLTYLAPCNGSCTTVDKTQLEFVKIDEQGWLNRSDPENADLGGTWASDVLIANNFTWTVMLPAGLREGKYVLRHEIIALHVANETDGAQAYPQCVNLDVAKGESAVGEMPVDGEAVRAPKFYTPEDPGIDVDIHRNISGYAIPGPQLWRYATPIRQEGEP